MESIRKIIHSQDAGLKLSARKSGETSINLSNDILAFLCSSPMDKGDERKITFKLYKEDILRSLVFIFNNLPLYISSSKSYTQVDFKNETFSKYHSQVEHFFGDNDTQEYTVNLYLRPDGRIYLNGLKAGDFSIRNFLIEDKTALVFQKNENGDFYIRIKIGEFDDESSFDDEELEASSISDNCVAQIIYFGAPGTGKSYAVNEQVGGENNPNAIRTTFHPDSDYSTFVGCYKPMEKDGADDTEITYKFCPQAFTKAYVAAWMNPNDDVYLVIEEINRGNCAQIFGDIFQLLDRNANGESSYAISSDNDLSKFLCDEFEKSEIEDEDIKCGRNMKLPSNLSIYATMNTSDQSLFPIDSAFKRRWDWKYVPINKDEEGHYIECGNVHYDWWNFLEIVNPKIDLTTGSEDKQLGFWFAKSENNGKITAEKFVSKVVFYLWNDVFKDYTTDSNNVFKTSNGIIKFRQFFDKNGVSLKVLNSFLEGLGVKTIQTSTTSMDDSSETMDEDGNVPTNTIAEKDFSKYSINDQGSYSKGKVVFEAIKLYVENNATMTNDEIVRTWLDLGINVPNLIETSTIHNSRIQSSSDARVQEKSKELSIEGRESIYVSNQFNVNRINEFMSKVNATNWGITIKVRIG